MTQPQPNQRNQPFPRLDAPMVDQNGMITQSWQWLMISMWQKLGGALTSVPRAAVAVQSPGSPVTLNDATTGEVLGTAVTAVALTMPTEFNVVNSGTSSDPTFGVTWKNELANKALMGPTSGGAATPGFRTLVPADLPVATTLAPGAVEPDGTTISVTNGGKIATLANAVYTVATLPALPLGGWVAFVSDANATLAAGIGTIVAGGGAHFVPVFYDGTHWIIG